MAKRSTAYPDRKTSNDQKLDNEKNYNHMTKHPSKINPVFLEDHYGVKKGVHNADKVTG